MIVGNKKKFKILLTQPYPDKANGVKSFSDVVKYVRATHI